jgi:Uma2 family endonuclease
MRDESRPDASSVSSFIPHPSSLPFGWLIIPDKKQVHVYRPGQPVQVLDNPQTVSGDPELPGFVLDLDPVWRP